MAWGKRLLLVIFAATLAGFVLFLRALPVAEQAQAVGEGDGIVVPTGGYARVATGLDLLANGGSRLLITGVHPDASLAAVLAEAGGTLPACCVDLDYEADNTAGNAVAAARWAERHGLRRLHLVTSWYHMPRSLLLFRDALPAITIIPHPVFPPQPEGGSWWWDLGAWRLVVIEFGKYAWALLRLELFQAEDYRV